MLMDRVKEFFGRVLGYKFHVELIPGMIRGLLPRGPRDCVCVFLCPNTRYLHVYYLYDIRYKVQEMSDRGKDQKGFPKGGMDEHGNTHLDIIL
jgi:hypothetical protein